MTSLEPPKPMNFNATNGLADKWKRWERAFRNYYEATELSKKKGATQVAILLHCAGEGAQDRFEKFEFTEEGEDKKDNLETVLTKFRNLCEPRKNLIYDTHLFFQRRQFEGESFENFLNCLRSEAEKCDFGDLKDRLICMQLIFGHRDKLVRDKLLLDPKMTLDKAIDICLDAEASKIRQSHMDSSRTINTVAPASFQSMPKQRYDPARARQSLLECKFCGRQHEPRQCPAYGKICKKCGKKNHFANVCRSSPSKRMNEIAAQNSSEVLANSDEFFRIGSLVSSDNSKSKVTEHLMVQDNDSVKYKIAFTLDTGAEVNVLPKKYFDNMCLSLNATNVTLTGFANNIVRPNGQTVVTCFDKANVRHDLLFYVSDAVNHAILGDSACFDLNLLKRINTCDADSNDVKLAYPLTLSNIRNDYCDLFSGYGVYDKEYHIAIKPDAQAIIQPPHKIPYALQPKLKTYMQTLTENGIIADVDEPTDWVHNIVVIEKKNKQLRICLDPKPLNAVILREHYLIPTPADVQAKLSNNTLFTVIDMKDAYWHVKLTDESSFLTTFHTPWGRKRFLRMPFGLSSASEIMQKRNEDTFGDIKGVHVIADDLIIAAENEQDHDCILSNVLQRAQAKGVKFNADKIQFKVSTVTYMGNLVSADGLKPDDRKVAAIVDMPPPQDVASLQRLLGMSRYLSQYVPNESTITAPLRELLKKNVEWSWNERHTAAFEQLKNALTRAPTLTFYDVTKPVTIQCDASQAGLGACLLQQGKPIAYASRSMSKAEQNYAQIEKEMLSIVFAVRKFHQYIYGKEFVVIENDHKPLEMIMKKTMDKVPPRLQRMLLCLQPYDLIVNYVPGKFMYVADTLSRAYLSDSDLPDNFVDSEHDFTYVVHSVIENLPVTTSKLDEIRDATACDSILATVMRYCQNEWPRTQRNVPFECRKYWHIRDTLYVCDGVLFTNDKIVVPLKLRPAMLNLIHESHFGVEKCKSRARELLYWPRMSYDIENLIRDCDICAKFQNQHHREPLLSHDIPNARFYKVGIDVMTFKGVDYLVLVDYFSKFPEMCILPDKTAQTIIEQLKCIFARYGIPNEVVSDNMPFQSKDFLQFATDWCFKATTSSPQFAQSNGQVERTIQTLKRVLKKADYENKDPYLSLLEYRNTPVAGLPYSPAQILMSKRLRSKVPCAVHLLEPSVVDICDSLNKLQSRQEFYYNRGTQPLPPLQKGEKVYVQQRGRRDSAVVVQQHHNPRSYVVQNRHGHMRRNRRHIFKAPKAPDFCNYDVCDYDRPVEIDSVHDAPVPDVTESSTLPRTSCFGRRIVRPKKYDDYCM